MSIIRYQIHILFFVSFIYFFLQMNTVNIKFIYKNSFRVLLNLHNYIFLKVNHNVSLEQDFLLKYLSL